MPLKSVNWTFFGETTFHDCASPETILPGPVTIDERVVGVRVDIARGPDDRQLRIEVARIGRDDGRRRAGRAGRLARR